MIYWLKLYYLKVRNRKWERRMMVSVLIVLISTVKLIIRYSISTSNYHQKEYTPRNHALSQIPKGRKRGYFLFPPTYILLPLSTTTHNQPIHLKRRSRPPSPRSDGTATLLQFTLNRQSSILSCRPNFRYWPK